MMKWILFFLLFFCCYGCSDNNNMILDEEELLARSIESRGAAFPRWKIFVFRTGSFGNSSQSACNSEERNIFYYFAPVVFKEYSIQEYLLKQFEVKSIPIEVGMAEMSYLAESYYEPYRKAIFFKDLDCIKVYNIEHEFLHAVQHLLLGYSMLGSSGKRSYEYEAYMAMDLLKCISSGRKLTPDEISGNPGKEKTEEYVTMLYELTQLNGKNKWGDLRFKFNEWIETWPGYTNETKIGNFEPRLLYYILDVHYKRITPIIIKK